MKRYFLGVLPSLIACLVTVSKAAELPLADGDRVVFLGDSITSANKWSNYVASYLILTHPELMLHVQSEGRGGTTIAESCVNPPSMAPENSIPTGERYPKRVAPYHPRYVFVMFGHNGALSATAFKNDYECLITNHIVGQSAAKPILIASHPQSDAGGKPTLGDYANKMQEIAIAGSFPFSDTWHTLLPTFTSSANWTQLQYPGTQSVPEIHCGTAGHILIAHQVIKNLGLPTLVSSAAVDAASKSIISTDQCTIGPITPNAYGGIDFSRLDKRLPWAIDENNPADGRAQAVAMLPSFANWQTYSLAVTGLADGIYDVLIDGVRVATVSNTQLAAGWNMADLTVGPVFDQTQEVLGRIRDMQGIDRTTLAATSPNKGVVRYNSNARASYETNGNRGALHEAALAPALAEIATYDNLIHAAAQPIARAFSLRRPTPAAASPSYVPAVGIPNPTWDAISPISVPTPGMPTSWPSVQATGFYYVDSAHLAATDSSNPFGFPDKPRLTIPSTLNAGSVVFVANCRTNTSLTATGTAATPVWIVGTGQSKVQPGAVGIYLSVSGSSYVIVDGVVFDGTGSPDTSASAAFSVRNGSHHVCFRNCSVRNMVAPPYNPTRFGSGGAGAWYSALTSISASGGNVNDVILYKTNISDNCGGQALDYESGRHCFLASGDSNGIYRVENVWILNCTFNNNSEDGIQLGQTSTNADQTLCRNFFIGGNTINNNGENAIDLKACDRIVVSQNTLSGYVKTSYRLGAVSGSDGTVCVINDDGKGPRESWWLFNHIHSSRVAFRNQAAGGEHYIIGNLVNNLQKDTTDSEPLSTGSSAGVAYWQSGGGSVHLINNTIFRVHGGFYLNNVAFAELNGNIVCDLIDHTAGWPVNINNFSTSSLSSNIYFDPNGPVRRDANALGASDLIDSDPKLANPAGANFAPLTGSPAIGIVHQSQSYQLFSDTFGSGTIAIYFNQKPRSGTSWTAGAFEPAGTRPVAPGGLRRIRP